MARYTGRHRLAVLPLDDGLTPVECLRVLAWAEALADPAWADELGRVSLLDELLTDRAGAVR